MRLEQQLSQSAPEAQGILSAAILAFVDAVEASNLELHSLMLLRHGHVLAQGWWAPYQPDDLHMLFSLSKSFTSTAVGLAVAQGLLTVDDPVLQFFPDDAPSEPSENLAAMRVRHLLSMSTGHAEDTLDRIFRATETRWARSFLEQPVEYAPGTHFLYNSGATYMLSAIVQRLTGMTLLDYLRPRLLEPLGIERATWETDPLGINTGGWGLSITTADIARFGQLYLQQGEWQGQQIVPAAWVAEASSSHISNGSKPESDWEQGYGYQFWRCRHNAYRGDGAFGQYCVIMPEQDAVLAITSGLQEMQPVLDLVWQHLLPAMGSTPLPEDHAAGEVLDGRLASLVLPTVQGQASSPVAAQVSGRTFVLDDNDQKVASVTFDFAADRTTIRIVNNHGTHLLVGGNRTWLAGSTTYDDGTSRPSAATGAWIDEQTFELKLRFTETPFGFTLTCRFSEEQVLLDHTDNVSFGPTERPRLQGRPG